MSTIGFLGAGKMGGAILASLLHGRVVPPARIIVCDAVAERRAELARRHGVPVTDDPASLAALCDVIFLAVKPQDLDALLQALAPRLTRRHLLVSIAAGKTLAGMQRLAGPAVRLVRVMPNLPVMVGEGMSAFCLGETATARDRRLLVRLLGCSGRVCELEERHFDVVTALSGSGPAFIAYVLQAMTDAAANLGLPAPVASLLAGQTLLGTARYLSETGAEPAAFMQAVASPKGTTAAGLAVLERSTLRGTLDRTLRAAARRSRALSR